MPRGAPDYSNVRAYGPLHRLDDLAEIAARLGSPITYDRAGNFVWYTDFSHGLQGIPVLVSDEGCDYFISADRSRFGAYSLKLDPSSEEDSYARWVSVTQFMLTGKLGLETLVSTDSNPEGLKLRMLYYDESTQHEAVLYYDSLSGDWSILTTNDAEPVILKGYKLQQGAGSWNPVKLVIDVENDRYVRAQIARNVVDISDYALKLSSSENLGQLAAQLYAYGSSTRHAALYLDYIIITQNEP